MLYSAMSTICVHDMLSSFILVCRQEQGFSLHYPFFFPMVTGWFYPRLKGLKHDDYLERLEAVLKENSDRIYSFYF